MARKTIAMTAMAAAIAAALIPAAASAQDYYGGWNDGYYSSREYRDSGRNDGRPAYRDYDGAYRGRGDYADAGYGYGQYYGRSHYRYRCHSDGTTGAIIGAIAGGLIGNGVAGRGDRTLGTIIGGGAGALAGSAIDRSSDRC